MGKVIKIARLLSTDIRSRANANLIRAAIDGVDDNITLDFEDVTFISRSFTDELYNVVNEHRNITLAYMSDFVKSMWNAVSKGRSVQRKPLKEHSEIKELEDMKSLESFLATI